MSESLMQNTESAPTSAENTSPPPMVMGTPEPLHRLDMRDCRARGIPYSGEIAEYITDRYIEGSSLKEICREPGIPPYGTVMGWLKKHEAFREMMDASRELRAFHMEEGALEAAASPADKDEVAAARLRYDSLVWAASVHNPERYGKKTTISGDSKRPVIFHVSTGVPEAAPNQIEAPEKEVIEAVGQEIIKAEEADGADESQPTDSLRT